VIGSIQHSFLDKLGVNFKELFLSNSRLVRNVEHSSRLMAMCGYMLNQAGGQNIAPTRAAQSMREIN
jgi:starch synthase